MESSASGSRFRLWLGILVSLICLAAIFIFIRPREILEALKNVNIGLLIFSALTLVAFMILRAIRWRFMLAGGWRGATPIPFASVFHIQNIGYLLNNLLPFRLGDLARALLIGNVPPITIAQGLSTMVVERVLDLLFIIILFPFTLAVVADLPPEVRTAVRVGGTAAVAAGIVLVIAANQRKRAREISGTVLSRIAFLDTESWVQRIDNLLLGLNTLTRFTDGLTLLLLSVAVWMPIVLGYYSGMRAVNLPVSLVQAAFVVCVAAFSVTAPSSPGQIGVFEAGVTFAAAGILGLPEGQAASFAFLYHAINYLVMGVLGLIGISRTGATFQSVVDSTRAFVQSRSS